MTEKSIANYLNVQMKTAGAGQRVVMMYDGIAKNLRAAVISFQDSDPEKFERINNSLQLAERLILELKLALDMDKGGELSRNLLNLYDFWISHISEANIDKEPQKVKDVLIMVDELRSTWDKAVKEARKMGMSY